MGWDRLSSHSNGSAGNGETPSCGQPEKLKGSGLPAESQLLLQAQQRESLEQVWAPQSNEHLGAEIPQGGEERRGGNCSRSAVGSGWEALRGTYSLFLPFCTHLARGFYQKAMDTLSLKCCFLTYMHMVQDLGVLSAITFF